MHLKLCTMANVVSLMTWAMTQAKKWTICVNRSGSLGASDGTPREFWVVSSSRSAVAPNFKGDVLTDSRLVERSSSSRLILFRVGVSVSSSVFMAS